MEEHDTGSEKITYDPELGCSIAIQPIWFLAALEIKLSLDGFLNIGKQQIVANHLSIAKEYKLTPKFCAIERQTGGTTAAVGDTFPRLPGSLSKFGILPLFCRNAHRASLDFDVAVFQLGRRVNYAKSYGSVRGRQLIAVQKVKTRTLENHEDAAPKF